MSYLQQRKHYLTLFMLLLVSLGSLFLGLSQGEYLFDFNNLVSAFQHKDELASQLLYQLRLPRVLAAFITGGLLALAGALMQMLVRNPLADPYVLGISGGAAVGALFAILIGLSPSLFHASTWVGAIAAMALVFGLSHALGKGQQQLSALKLVLTGVVLAAGWGAIISFILTIADSARLQGMLFWLMGDLSYAQGLTWPGWVLLIGLLVSFSLAKPLNLLGRGAMVASTLGVNAIRLQYSLLVLTSILTATAVTLAGSIGFVGLIVPHLLRLAGLTDHRWLLPACVLAGGSLLVIADMLSRVLFSPQQLPVGILTALLGIPVFFYLMYRQQGRR